MLPKQFTQVPGSAKLYFSPLAPKTYIGNSLRTLIPSHDLLWKDVFLLPRIASPDSKIRELKVLNRILYANKAFFNIGIVDSPLSTFCQTFEESLDY